MYSCLVLPCFFSIRITLSSQKFQTPFQNIRTNPWISRNRPVIQTITYQEPKSVDELMYASIDRTTSFRIKSLDESIYSSGYGSQDSRCQTFPFFNELFLK